MIFLKKNNSRGFTLLELLVVIAIIGILASVIMVSVGSSRTKAQKAAFKAEVAGAIPGWVHTCYSGNITASSTSIATWGTVVQSCGATGSGTFTVPATSISVSGCTGTATDSGATFVAACN